MTFTLSRRTLLIIGAIVVVGVAFGIGLIVSGGKTKTVVTTVAIGESAEEEESATAQAEKEIETEEASDEGNCDEKGIDKAPHNQGTCFEEGHKFVVVNEHSTLELKTLSAKLLDIRKSKTLNGYSSETANGIYVTFELSITNKAHEPEVFEEEQCVLYIDGNVYTEDFEVQNGGEEQSFLWQGTEIQPQNAQVGTVTFDVPATVLRHLAKNGNLDITNFGEGANEAHDIGVIRTYQ